MRQGMKRSERLVMALSGLLYVMICLVPLSNLLLVPIPMVRIALVAAGAWGLVLLLFGNRPGRITALSGLVLGVFFLLYLVVDRGAPNASFMRFLEDLYFALEKLYFFEPLSETRYERFEGPILWVLALLLSSGTWLFFMKRFRYAALIACGIVCFLLSYEMAGKDAKLAFAAFCVMAVVLYAGNIHEKRMEAEVEQKGSGTGNRMLGAIPVAILTLVLTLLFQKQDTPLRWEWLDNQFYNVYSRIEDRFSKTQSEYFNLSATGFGSRENLLGGSVRLSNTFVLEVDADYRAYLRGAAYQEYTGSNWSTVDPALDYTVEGFPESSRDLMEFGLVFELLPAESLFEASLEEEEEEALVELYNGFRDGSILEVIYPQLQMRVTYRNIITRTLMSPMKTILPVRWQSGPVLELSQNSRAILLNNGYFGPGSSYQLEYHQPMYGDGMLRALLPVSEEGLYRDALGEYTEQWNRMHNDVLYGVVDAEQLRQWVRPNISRDFGQQFVDDELALSSYVEDNTDPTQTPVYRQMASLMRRAASIQESYTVLPDTVTDRTRALALEWTKDADSDYERAIALRDALRRSYPYSLTMPRLPAETDFVDWFLFDQQSGYCTSYATAMTVMLRTLGIPSRYVEGYVLPDRGDGDDPFKVTNQQAHAWTEAYFEGFGWLSFEPTPGFSGVTDTLARSVSDVEGSIGNSDFFDLEELMRRYGENRGEFDFVPGEFDPIESREPVEPRQLLYLVLLGLAAALFLPNLFSILAHALQMKLATSRRQLVMRFLLMMDWLTLAGIPLKNGESLPEYAKRVDMEFYFPETTFRHLCELFSRVRYGAKEPGPAELRLMNEMAKELRAQVVREIGLRRFIPMRHLLLKI